MRKAHLVRFPMVKPIRPGTDPSPRLSMNSHIFLDLFQDLTALNMSIDNDVILVTSSILNLLV